MPTRREGIINLESAIALLIHNQAQFMAHLEEDRRRLSKVESEHVDLKAIILRNDANLLENKEMLRDLQESRKRMEAIFAEHQALLKQHEENQMEFMELRKAIKNLPDAIQRKIGFRPPA